MLKHVFLFLVLFCAIKLITGNPNGGYGNIVAGSGGTKTVGSVPIAVHSTRTITYRDDVPQIQRVSGSLKAPFIEVAPNTNRLHLMFKSQSGSLFNSNSDQPFIKIDPSRPQTSVLVDSTDTLEQNVRPITYSTYVMMNDGRNSKIEENKIEQQQIHKVDNPIEGFHLKTFPRKFSESQIAYSNQNEAERDQTQTQSSFVKQENQLQPPTHQPYPKIEIPNPNVSSSYSNIVKVNTENKSAWEAARKILGSDHEIFRYQSPSIITTKNTFHSSNTKQMDEHLTPVIQEVAKQFFTAPSKPSYTGMKYYQLLVKPVPNYQINVHKSAPTVGHEIIQSNPTIQTEIKNSGELHQKTFYVPIVQTNQNEPIKITVPVITQRINGFSQPTIVPVQRIETNRVQPIHQYVPTSQIVVPLVQPTQIPQIQFQSLPKSDKPIYSRVVHQMFPTIQYQHKTLIPLTQTSQTIHTNPFVHRTVDNQAKMHHKIQSVKPMSVAKFVETPTIIRSVIQTHPITNKVEILQQHQQSAKIQAEPVNVVIESNQPPANIQVAQPETSVTQVVSQTDHLKQTESNKNLSTAIQYENLVTGIRINRLNQEETPQIEQLKSSVEYDENVSEAETLNSLNQNSEQIEQSSQVSVTGEQLANVNKQPALYLLEPVEQKSVSTDIEGQ
ncbi:hypothetical protein RDWZM_008244 [Blomia tropicalis]|uniref:Uncharacterized protein n=1 Tax=Blomia tropicalis TaxID=40697 RepID=A0A9Q0M1E5_BLOTA|nr:hypothetical protein RDWZM_008244 [Blomia tropicalis]